MEKVAETNIVNLAFENPKQLKLSFVGLPVTKLWIFKYQDLPIVKFVIL